MPPTELRTFIGSHDYAISTEFYQELGWRIAYDAPDLRLLELGNCRFYLQPAYVKDWCDNTMLHLSVDDVDSWYAFAKQAVGLRRGTGAGVSGPPRDAGYARVFHIHDPAGVLLHVAQFPT